MALADLQAKIESSLANASELTCSLFAKDPWNAERVTEFVNTVRNVTVATILRNGGPHAAATIGACREGEFYFSATPGSTMLGNLRRDSRVAFTIADATHTVVGRGKARGVGRSVDHPQLIDDLAIVSPWGLFTPEGWDGFIWTIEIDRIFAN
jgi:hypothetical protein